MAEQDDAQAVDQESRPAPDSGALQRAVDEAEQEVAAGHFIEHEVMKERLRRCFAGAD